MKFQINWIGVSGAVNTWSAAPNRLASENAERFLQYYHAKEHDGCTVYGRDEFIDGDTLVGELYCAPKEEGDAV